MTTPSTTGAGRALLVYTGLRLALLLVCLVVLRLLGLSGLLAAGAAVLLSALLSVVLLRGQRDALTAASIARADQRRADKQARRARLDDPDTRPDSHPGTG